jgi:hypothetical protein
LGMMEIDIQTDRALFNGKIVVVIHRYVLRWLKNIWLFFSQHLY